MTPGFFLDKFYSSYLFFSEVGRRGVAESFTEAHEQKPFTTQPSKRFRLCLVLTSIIREPRVAFPLEVHAIKLGALLLTEVLGSLGAVLRGATGRSRHMTM